MELMLLFAATYGYDANCHAPGSAEMAPVTPGAMSAFSPENGISYLVQ